jgi:hypothetical protein
MTAWKSGPPKDRSISVPTITLEMMPMVHAPDSDRTPRNSRARYSHRTIKAFRSLPIVGEGNVVVANESDQIGLVVDMKDH